MRIWERSRLSIDAAVRNADQDRAGL